MKDMDKPFDPAAMDRQADTVEALAIHIQNTLVGVIDFKAALYVTEDIYMTLALRDRSRVLNTHDRSPVIAYGNVYISVKRGK